MRQIPPVPLRRCDTAESIGSVDSEKTMSVASCDRPEVIQMVPKVDVEIKFNGKQISNGMRVNRSRSMQSLNSLRSSPPGGHPMSIDANDPSRRASLYSFGGFSGFSSLSSSPEILDDVNLSPDEVRDLRIENHELRAADHRQKAEICELKAKILTLTGQLAKCRQLALKLMKSHPRT